MTAGEGHPVEDGFAMSTINELAVSTAPEVWSWAFDGDHEARERCFEAWWRSEESLFSHRLACVIREAGEAIGLELGYTREEKAAAAGPTISIASDVLPPALRVHLLSAFGWFDYLCPPIPENAYYVQWLATDPRVHGRGLGKQLLTDVFARSRSRGFAEVQLDVNSANAAVGFYEHVGMEIVSESRVFPLERHGIPSHYRMVKYL